MSKQEVVDAFNAVVVAAWQSPITGDVYSLTRGTLEARSMHHAVMTTLLMLQPFAAQKLRNTEREIEAQIVAANEADRPGLIDALREVRVGAFELAQQAQAAVGKEHRSMRGMRHVVTDLLACFDPEAHASYRAVKYSGEDGKATPESRLKATVAAYSRLVELLFVPGF